ncbi:hypothetical protein EV178_001237 [Coemansia sp. RSA 1646]|nr:hypothetical protein EV178_001237 [Coemansia sp. RSA 1646]KAJ2213890.1 hypothetical protein EV179_003474 [Coemansia sp. RSA 487]
MRSGPFLEIALDKPELLVRGSFDEASASLLSGRLIVHLHETIRVRSLKLVFTGRVDTSLNQNVVPYTVARDEHREIVRREWVFLESQKPPITWGPENKVFPFDFLLPGDNPETIVTALGKVRYQLHATLERTSFHANLTASQEIFVKRGPISGAAWALALMESIEATGEWSQQLDYRVSVPSRSLKDGEVFTTRFELEPRIKGMKLVAVGVLIKEYTRYYSTTGDPLHRFSRVVARNENYISQTGNCGVAPRMADDCMDLVDATNIQIPLSVPEAYGTIQYDVLTDLIEVRHRIKFLIKLRDTNMLIHSIFIAVPVSIMPVTARDESNILPRYEPTLAGPGGAVLMRSNTQPPAYDAVVCRYGHPGGRLRQSDRNSNVARRPLVHGSNASSHASATSSAGPSTPAAMVGPGTVVDGFPGPIHRSGSQFYLASPDSSPPLQPVGTSSSHASSPDNAYSSSTAQTIHETTEQLPQVVLDQPMLQLTQTSTNTTTASVPSAANTHVAANASGSRRSSRSGGDGESRRGSVSSKAASLHDILAGSKISDKVRSIFHARTSSTSSVSNGHQNRPTHHRHSRQHSRETNLTRYEASQQPNCRSMTPPPARVHNSQCNGGGGVSPRHSSVGPSIMHPAYSYDSDLRQNPGHIPVLGAPSSHGYALTLSSNMAALGTETSRNLLHHTIPGTHQQVHGFMLKTRQTGYPKSNSALYTIWTGANDCPALGGIGSLKPDRKFQVSDIEESILQDVLILMPPPAEDMPMAKHDKPNAHTQPTHLSNHRTRVAYPITHYITVDLPHNYDHLLPHEHNGTHLAAPSTSASGSPLHLHPVPSTVTGPGYPSAKLHKRSAVTSSVSHAVQSTAVGGGATRLQIMVHDAYGFIKHAEENPLCYGFNPAMMNKTCSEQPHCHDRVWIDDSNIGTGVHY